MGQFSSYWLYQRFEQRGSQEPIPVYPNTYSINGDGTMPLVVRNEDDTECGYVPPIEPIYRWANIPITQDYICDECGYVPPTPTGNKFVARYLEGTSANTIYVDCNDNPTLTSGETKPSGYNYMAMRDAVIGQCVNIIDDNAFYSCVGLSSITISNSVTSIGNSAFFCCYNLTGITIPNSVTTIGGGAFSNCSGLTSVVIPNSVTTIDGSAFEYCSGLTSVVIGNGVTSISSYAFAYCISLTNVVIPDSVTSIDFCAFLNCTSLTSVTIPNSVTSIGERAFIACNSLTSVTCLATTPPTLGWLAFDGSTCPIYVPASSVDVYKSASGWSEWAYRIQPIS